MEEQECFPEKNRDEDLLEKILEEENRRILYQGNPQIGGKETRSDSDAVFRWDVSERNLRQCYISRRRMCVYWHIGQRKN